MAAERMAEYLDIGQVKRTPPQHREAVSQLLAKASNRRDQDQITRALLRVIDSKEGNPIERMIALTRGAVALTAWVSAIEATEVVARDLLCAPSCRPSAGLRGRVEHVATHVDTIPQELREKVAQRIRLRHDIVHASSRTETLDIVSAMELKDICGPFEDFRTAVVTSLLEKRFGVSDAKALMSDHKLKALGLNDEERAEIRRLNTPSAARIT